MSDVRIMKKNNNRNIEYVASSLEQQSEICFTVSAVGMPPLWVQLWSFHSSRFYCLTCGDLKKKMEGRRDIKGEKGVEQERRKEEAAKRKNNKIIIIENYLKTKTKTKNKPAGQASFADLF